MRQFKKIAERLKERLKAYSNYLLIFVLVLLTASFIRNIVKVSRAEKKIEEAQERVEKLKEENQELSQKLESVKSQEYIEKQLRDKLGLAKEEETVVVLPDDEVLRKLAPKLEEEEDVLPDPNWKKWVKLFF